MSKNVLHNDFLFDSRVAHRHIRDGKIDRSEYDKFLSSLPDLEDQSEDIGELVYESHKQKEESEDDSSSEDEQQ